MKIDYKPLPRVVLIRPNRHEGMVLWREGGKVHMVFLSLEGVPYPLRDGRNVRVRQTHPGDPIPDMLTEPMTLASAYQHIWDQLEAWRKSRNV